MCTGDSHTHLCDQHSSSRQALVSLGRYRRSHQALVGLSWLTCPLLPSTLRVGPAVPCLFLPQAMTSPGIPSLPVLPSPSISPAPPIAGDLEEGVSGCGDSTSLRHMMAGPLRRAGAGSHLVTWVVVLLQVRVGQSLFHLNPLMRVERQHLVQ